MYNHQKVPQNIGVHFTQIGIAIFENQKVIFGAEVYHVFNHCSKSRLKFN